MTKVTKVCPNLIGWEDRKSASIHTLWETARVPVLNTCLKEQCIAYKDGKCMKYDNEVEVKEDD